MMILEPSVSWPCIPAKKSLQILMLSNYEIARWWLGPGGSEGLVIVDVSLKRRTKSSVTV